MDGDLQQLPHLRFSLFSFFAWGQLMMSVGNENRERERGQTAVWSFHKEDPGEGVGGVMATCRSVEWNHKSRGRAFRSV